MAMLDSQVAILENALARYGATGQVPGPIGSRHPSITPFGTFAAADGLIVIAAANDSLFRQALRRPRPWRRVAGTTPVRHRTPLRTELPPRPAGGDQLCT